MIKIKGSINAIFTWIEIFVGIAGTLIFIFSIYNFIRGSWFIYIVKVTGYTYKGAIVTRDVGKIGIVYTSPFLISMITGIGALRRYTLARRINLVVMPLIFSYTVLFLTKWLGILEYLAKFYFRSI